jgi:hypothetical protein
LRLFVVLVQAVVAAEVGHLELAYDYFGEAAFLASATSITTLGMASTWPRWPGPGSPRWPGLAACATTAARSASLPEPYPDRRSCIAIRSDYRYGSTSTDGYPHVTSCRESRKRSNKGRSISVPIISCPATSNRNPETPSRSRSPDLYSRRSFWNNCLCEGGLHQDIQEGREPETAGRGLPCRRVWGLTNGLRRFRDSNAVTWRSRLLADHQMGTWRSYSCASGWRQEGACTKDQGVP